MEILVLHEFTVEDESKKIMDIGITANEWLKRFPEAKYIFTGDNHTGFIFEEDYRYVINSGSLLRQTADQKDYQPFVVFVDTEKEIIEKIFVPDDGLMVDDEYIKKEDERNNRIESFVDSIKNNKKISLSFLDNLEEEIKLNKKELGEDKINIVNELMEECNEKNSM